MKSYKIPIIIAVLILVIVGAWFIWPEGRVGQEELYSNQSTTLELDSQAEGGSTIKEAMSTHPVSLPALMTKEYNGKDLQLGQVLDNNSVYTRYYVTYTSGELTISGIMNIPKGKGPFPVLILNHGYIDPAIYTNGRGLKREQDYLARQGFAVLHPDYRNHAQSSKDPQTDVNFRLGYVEDVINAIYAVKNSKLESLDTSKIGMLGHSMGGGVTLNVIVTQPALVQAAVLFAPVSTDQRDNFERWTKSRPETVEKIIELYGLPHDNPEFWNNVSSDNFLGQIKTPILLHHGTADDSVPIEWSDKLVNKLEGLQKSVDYRVYDGQPHEFTSDWPEVMSVTTEFFNKELGIIS